MIECHNPHQIECNCEGAIHTVKSMKIEVYKGFCVRLGGKAKIRPAARLATSKLMRTVSSV